MAEVAAVNDVRCWELGGIILEGSKQVEWHKSQQGCVW